MMFNSLPHENLDEEYPMKTDFMKILTPSLLFISTLPVFAQGGVESRPWRVSIGSEYWAGIGKGGLTSTEKSICAVALTQSFVTSCAGSTTGSGAGGFRVSLFKEQAGIELGPSAGYINGGPGAGKINLSAPNGGVLNYGASANTARFLGEARKTWTFLGGWGFRMGTGLGMSVVNQVSSCEDDGTLNLTCSQAGAVKYSSLEWFTWELSPAVIYKDVALGLRYVGFGRSGQIPWNTVGAFFAIDF